MGFIAQTSLLSDLSVSEAMRRQVIQLPRTATFDACINRFVKYKVNAVLITEEDGTPAGVVSKTDVMGAYYAGLPVSTPVENVMAGPPVFCGSDDTLDAALEIMRQQDIYRVYVQDGGDVVGVIAHPDVVGLLYQLCHGCRYSRRNRVRNGNGPPPLAVRDVMTSSVESYPEDGPLTGIMEALSACRFGALLITGAEGEPAGVVSKSDLMLAYRHGVDPSEPASSIMGSPVKSRDEGEYLETALRTLIFSQIQRIFVHRGDPSQIVGVLSLSDAARIRSGSCQACGISRMIKAR